MAHTIISGHPRTIDAAAIKTKVEGNAAMLAAYQAYVDSVHGLWGNNYLGDQILAHHNGLVYALGTVAGITYPASQTPADFGAEAVRILDEERINESPIPTSGDNNRFADEDTLTNASLAYDWAFALMTTTEKNNIGGWLLDSAANAETTGFGIGAGANTHIWSSSCFEAAHIEMPGIVTVHDAVDTGGGSRDTEAQGYVDDFDNRWLTGGWLDAQNWGAYPLGGYSETSRYSAWHPKRFLKFMSIWKKVTSPSEDYFKDTTPGGHPPHFMKYQPRSLAYQICPTGYDDAAYPNGVRWRNIKQGLTGCEFLGWLNTDNVRNSFVEQMGILTSQAAADADMAALAQWFVQERGDVYSGVWWKHLEQFLWYDPDVVPKSPTTLALPKAYHAERQGTVYIKSGFDSRGDTQVLLRYGRWVFHGHGYEGEWQKWTNGFIVHRRGPILLVRKGANRGATDSVRWNGMTFGDSTVTGDYRGIEKGGVGAFTDDVADYVALSNYDWETDPKVSDQSGNGYVWAEFTPTKMYKTANVDSVKRTHFFIHPPSDTENAFLVVFDEFTTDSTDIEAAFEVCSAYAPVVGGTPTVLETDTTPDPDFDWKIQYDGVNFIDVCNDLPGNDPYSLQDYAYARGRAFVECLNPDNIKIIVTGGTWDESSNVGYEWVDEDGVQNFDSSDYGTMRNADGGALNAGAFFTQIVPTDADLTKTMLTGIQVCESGKGQVAQQRVDGTNLMLAHLQDSPTEYLVGFSTQGASALTSADYTCPSSSNVKHILEGFAPSTQFEVTQDAVLIVNVTSDAEGTLTFDSSGGGAFVLTQGTGEPAPTASVGGTPLIWVPQAYTQPALILDQISGAVGAWSTRKLRTAYAGDCLRVRRDSDNDELGIGFVGDQLDTNALLNFVGGANGFIRTWYDQGENGNDGSQTTGSLQAQIVQNGILITENGRPMLLWDGVDDEYTTPDTITTDSETMFGIMQFNADNDDMVGLGLSTSGNYLGLWMRDNAQGTEMSWAVTGFTDGTQALRNGSDFGHDLGVLSGKHSDTAIELFKNGSSLRSTTLTSPNISGAYIIGARSSPSQSFSGKFGELIIFDTALPDDTMRFIETEQIQVFGIT